MCGICGFVLKTTHSKQASLDDLNAMLKRLEFRGPDERGIFENSPTYLGMQRLSIIDRENGKQPLIDEISGVSLVYNGELYNYLELRKTLEKLGHRFRTDSDTEVILKAYLQYDSKCVDYFNGMYAFCLWDPRINSLYMARDHLGQKPFYYINTNKLFAFASDIRSLLAHSLINEKINQSQIKSYLQNRHVPGPNTLVSSIYQLPPGHHANYSDAKGINQRPYWQFQFKPNTNLHLDEFKDKFNALWPEVIKRHLVSEVPLGGFLSGGIDSSLIAIEAAKQSSSFSTFSIGFKDKNFDETAYAQQVANKIGCPHTVIQFEDSFENLLNAWSRAYDQPLSDPAVFPTLSLARESRKQITVALAGDGADELFAGYQRYYSMLIAKNIRKIPAPLRALLSYLFAIKAKLFLSHSAPRRWLTAVSRRLKLMQNNPELEYMSQFHLFNHNELKQILKSQSPPLTYENQFTQNHIVHNMLQHDANHWLPDQMLVKTDRATMAYSLELRLPFLDRQMIELATELPVNLLINKSKLKYGLRQIASLHLPKSISLRAKHGFAVPIDSWIREDSSFVRDLYAQACVENQDIFNPGILKIYWDQHIKRTHNHGEKLLTLLLFFLWRKEHRL